MFRGMLLVIVLGVLWMTAACNGPMDRRWLSPAEFNHSASAPGVPVIHLPEAGAIAFDGSLEDAAWKNAAEFHELGFSQGTGLLGFPTSVRLLKNGRVLWIGLDCRIPPDKKGQIPADAIDKESVEVWIDPGPTRFSFYQVIFKSDGKIQSPWIPAATLAKGFQVKTLRRADGYTAEIRVDLEALTDFGTAPGPNVGFNLARGSAGGWGSLVGVIGHVHKPTQFWQLDFTGKLPESSPQARYHEPFKAGADVRSMAHTLLTEWRRADTGPRDRAWARVQVEMDALERKLAEDEKDVWGRPQEIAILTWRALTGWAASDGRAIAIPEPVAAMQSQFASYPGGPFPATRWRQDAFISTFDDTPQPYAIRVPSNYDPKKPLPLVLFLHGSGGTDSGSGAILERYESDPPCILVRVNGRQYGWFDTLAMRDTLQIIDDVTSRYAIDPDRIYVTGYSAGAYGTMLLGETHPERYAALACIAGGIKGKNPQVLRNLDTLFIHGCSDPNVRPGSNAAMDALELAAINAPARMCMIPASGHGVTVDRYEDYLFQFRRKAAPASVACFTDLWNPAPASQYWVNILALADPHIPAGIRANITGTTLLVQTANVAECTFDMLTMPNRPASLVIDGQRFDIHPGNFLLCKRNGFAWKVDTGNSRPQPDTTAYRSGGVIQLYADGSPIIIAPEQFKENAEKLSHRTVAASSPWIHIPVYSDKDVSDELLRKHHLILLGSAKVNKVTARLAAMEKDWPLPVDAETVTLDKQHAYSLSDHVVEAVTFHPLNRSLRAWVILTDAALPADSPILKGDGNWRRLPDITVIDIKTGNMVERRKLETDWKPQSVPMWDD